MSALLFGSISTVADTSELQREAFNAAFAQHGLDWRWDQDDYVAMLEKNGGSDRVAAYAEARDEVVDAAAVHRTKSEIFRQRLAEGGVAPRPGVVDAIQAARGQGFKVGLVTTTSKENVTALVEALSPDIDLTAFDVVIDAGQVEHPKPDKEAYALALELLGEDGSDCVSVEDNVGGVASATSIGIPCVAFPNENTAGHDFVGAAARVDSLDFTHLRSLSLHTTRTDA